MPLIHKENGRFGTDLALWEIHEDLPFFLERLELTPADREFLQGLHPRRALEWAASRYLLKILLDRPIPFDCLADDDGRPYIPDDPRFVSISHSHGMAAVALSNERVGIDIQRESPKIKRLYHKFMNTRELAGREDVPIDIIHLVWSAKEAMYKLYSKAALDFREHMEVDLPEKTSRYGLIHGVVHKGDVHIRCEIHYRFIHGYIWVYALPV